MKFSLTKFEQLALTSHLVVQPSPNPEYGRKRLRAWDALGVSALADALATIQAVGGNGPPAAEWSDKTTQVEVDLETDLVEYIINGLGGQIAGVWADTLTRVRERLSEAKKA